VASTQTHTQRQRQRQRQQQIDLAADRFGLAFSLGEASVTHSVTQSLSQYKGIRRSVGRPCAEEPATLVRRTGEHLSGKFTRKW